MQYIAFRARSDMEDAADRIDPLPAPTACVDGVQRHMQQYEQTVSALQLENQELRTRLRQALQELDLLQQQPGEMSSFSVPETSQPAISAQAPATVEAPQTAVQPTGQIAPQGFTLRPRRIQLHTRRILQISTFMEHLISVSQDGTARIISTEGQSLHCFRADAQVRACLIDQRILCWCTQRKLCLHSLDKIPRLEPYADVSDLNQTVIRDITGQLTFPLQATPECICRAGSRFFVFMAGYVAVVDISPQGFQIVAEEAFLDDQGAQFDFLCACAIDNRAFAAIRMGPRSSRVVEVSDELECRAYQLSANYNIICMVEVQRAILCICGPALRLAIIGAGQPQELPEQALEQPTCACTDGQRLFIGALHQERVCVLIYHVEVVGDSMQFRREKSILLDDYQGVITSICVRDQTLILGSSSGEILVRACQ